MSEARTAPVPAILTKRVRRPTSWLGPVAVVLALVVALSSVAIYGGYTPLAPTDIVIAGLAVANLLCILLLFVLVVAEAWSLIAAFRARVAGARLHVRIVGLFSIIAVVPAILMAVIGSITLDTSLNPGFMRDVPGFIWHATIVAGRIREAQCKSLLQEALLTAADLNRARVMFDADRQLFREFFASRARFLGFTAAALMHSDGTIVEKVDKPDPNAETGTAVVHPAPTDFDDARKNELTCLILDEGQTFVALRQIPAFNDTYLYVARPVDRPSVEFASQASQLFNLYKGFDSHRQSIRLAFAVMYGFIALIMLLSATWLGLSFANQLVAPIRRLIAATDQVSSGNLYVQVPVHRSEGDLAHLGETFNKMTSELRLQQNRLIAASNLIDERRLFTEAVLSGVPVAVIGIGPKGQVTVLNPSAEKLMSANAETASSAVGQPIENVLPEVAPVLNEAREGFARLVQSQIAVNRGGRDRIFNVRVTSDAARADKSYVVTLDDITDLVTAQRTAAWADVARRIAHEIKNPLTPIALSAERIRRHLDRATPADSASARVVRSCAETIAGAVETVRQLVDEFSTLARFPVAKPQPADLNDVIESALSMFNGRLDGIRLHKSLASDLPHVMADSEAIKRAVANLVDNAAEALQDSVMREIEISTALVASRDAVEITVADTGHGVTRELKEKLFLPYFSTKKRGTGLGLAIVSRIVEDHHGSIRLEENHPVGTRFIVELPVVPEGATPATQHA
jgi:two-component system, NtrC family, nitrogen regulation sensor histidine kinase NtrY